MSESHKTAFPHQFKYGDGTAHRSDGMLLRDYFAAAAMQGAMVNASGLGGMDADARKDVWEQLALLVYECADSMLKAREK